MFGRTLIGAVSFAALAITLSSSHQAAAQLVPTDPSNAVLIDLGAIDGGRAAPNIVGGSRTGVGSGILGTMPGGNGQLLLPPQNTPSSRLMTPEGRTAAVPQLREPEAELTPERAPRRAPAAQPKIAQPKAPAQPKLAAAPAQPKASAPLPSRAVEPAQPKAAPAALPQIALPTVPAPATPSMAAPSTPAPAPSNSGPLALDAAPTPPPDIPAMQAVGPLAALPAPTPAAPKASPAAKASTPPAAKSASPTPPPTVLAPKAPDAPSAAPAPAASAPAQQQQAALPPATKGPSPAAPATADSLEIRFDLGDANLSNDAKAALDKLSDGLKGSEKSRIQLLAYASEDQISPSKARRLSLSRALAVRSHLIAKGIRSTRIDVRALGDQIPGGEPNRVDLKVTDR